CRICAVAQVDDAYVSGYLPNDRPSNGLASGCDAVLPGGLVPRIKWIRRDDLCRRRHRVSMAFVEARTKVRRPYYLHRSTSRPNIVTPIRALRLAKDDGYHSSNIYSQRLASALTLERVVRGCASIN